MERIVAADPALAERLRLDRAIMQALERAGAATLDDPVPGRSLRAAGPQPWPWWRRVAQYMYENSDVTACPRRAHGPPYAEGRITIISLRAFVTPGTARTTRSASALNSSFSAMPDSRTTPVTSSRYSKTPGWGSPTWSS